MSLLNFLGVLAVAGVAYSLPNSISGINDALVVPRTVNSPHTTCGGYIEAPGVISMSNITANTSCIWTINTLEPSYFGLSNYSIIHGYDRLAIYRVAYGVPSLPTFISGSGSLYPMPGGLFLVTLNMSSLGYYASSFTLNIYSSGYSYNGVTGFNITRSQSGNWSYPSGGGYYKIYENALFVVSPSRATKSTNITFTSFDLRQNRDYLRVYSLQNNVFASVANLTGTSIPANVTLGGGGNGLMIFTSQTGGSHRGFGFNWTMDGHEEDMIDSSGGAVISNVYWLSILGILRALLVDFE